MVELGNRVRDKKDVDFDESKLYDVIITAQNPRYRLPAAAARSMILNFATRQFLSPQDEFVGDDVVEVYCSAGPCAHEVFTWNAYDSAQPVFKEAVVRFGQQAEELDYGETKPKLYFFIELRGCVFREPLGPFRKQLKDSFHIRVKTYVRDHQPIPPRKSAAVG